MVAKFEIEKFNGTKLPLWKLKMKAIWRKDNSLPVTDGRPADITDEMWKEMDGNVIVNLHLTMVDSVLSSIVEKKTKKEI